MSELRFDGKVVVVTGAGRNLGREYALLFAARGARVVVNDLGVGISDTDGVADAPSDPPADAVVEEIRAAGGEAVANRDTISTPEGGRAIVDAALDAFGAVDVVVNNAGQVRMAPFPELTEAQLDAVIDTRSTSVGRRGR
jgi:NAD(P)-dependent dehydrogenase (short-subunit alcohol dehydrogenase family)